MMSRVIRTLLVAFSCAVILFSTAFPASANGSYKSSEYKGEANLNNIQAKTDETVYNPPMSLKEIQDRQGKGGLNELQGKADIDKMKNPDNSTGTSFIEGVKDALGKTTK
ncbi:MAG: hypothetical protein N5P05_003060 [Chroococcopsis gigantea SAG 12.99]|jgi:hypothetical protein|nr:hypothetical protein [Chlorogloea purpurea SAG 13.99]MDV3001454.1 hypothetical protein [Chroococcopsis gigantea SAG 12.99]